MRFSHDRRRLLKTGAGLAASAAAPALLSPVVAQAASAPRALAMKHTHTGESIDIVFATGQQYDDAALAQLDRFLRDHYTGEVGRIDPQLHELLYTLGRRLDTQAPFHVISGYRCAATNERLRAHGGGGVAKRSLHMVGQAIDIRVPGVQLATLRDAALSLKAGGVGYYPGSQFVHVDTGPVRHW